ncbi:unnamed protein product [Cyclocybe aegerita]|uniref:DUF974-domain-containing protein n=1 Tax=Cyclocybe aegerita TaxID=1973307 RepID=A0A8S0WFG9_CYCAE|nr:unnamed protein product [Cyclocybe aegerita]
MTTTDPAHLLSLKVMRVSRPELASAWQPFYSSSPSFSAHSSASILSLQGNTPLPGHPKTLRDLTHPSELLTLPSSFGSIQLGETFSSCLCVNNETQLEIEVAQVKVEMQTVTTKVVLHEMDGTGASLDGGDTLERVVHHEIKELGQHVLACTVTYRLPPNTRPVPGAAEDAGDPRLQTFRKFYKFAVTNPLSVKTKIHSPKSPSALLSPVDREKIFLEVHIQNLTQDAIRFERMRLECTENWEAIDANIISSGGFEKSIFSDTTTLMQPQDMRQYVYILTPKVIDLFPTTHPPGSIIPLGRLDISWRSSFGEPGRLLTSMLSRRIPVVAPPPQPASAVPPHLKRTIGGSISRPHSPSISQSRPGTPPANQLPGTPGTAGNRSSMSATMRPQSPQSIANSLLPPLPEIEALLIVRRVPRDNVFVERPFSMTFSVVVSSVVPLGRENSKRTVTLAIQHIRPRKLYPLVAPRPAEAFSPRVPTSGFSTPSSATATFNYALAHQKILAATVRPPASEPLTSEPENAEALPPPYFEGRGDEHKILTSGVSFVGPSVIFLSPVELDFSTANEDKRAHMEAVQEFDLSFIGLRTGYSTIGGLRILLVDDRLVDNLNEIGGTKMKARVLKQHDVIGEVWIKS